MEFQDNKKNFENAFNCKECPANSGKNGCPMWWIFKAKNEHGKEYIRSECGFVAMPTFLHEYVVASHGMAAATESMRNYFIRGVEEIKRLDKQNGQDLVEGR